jgi:DNA-binding transcriptional LysR family regulator
MPIGHTLPGMDLKRLRTFVAVAEHGTISAAAEVLHITQPALSRQLAGFEQELGFKLFGRGGNRLLLTAPGEQLLAECRSLIAHVAALSERAQALRRGDLAVLKIAGSALTVEGLFPDFLRRWEQRTAAPKLALIEADADRQLAMLERGEAHLAISVLNVIEMDERRFASRLLPWFRVLAAYAPSRPIGRGDTIEIGDLARYPLLLPNPTYATRSIFDAACRVAGARPDVRVESGAGHALLALAEAGHGVAIIPSIMRTDPSTLSTLRVTHRRKELGIELAVLWDRRRSFARHTEAFAEVLARYVKQTFGRRRASAGRAS